MGGSVLVGESSQELVFEAAMSRERWRRRRRRLVSVVAKRGAGIVICSAGVCTCTETSYVQGLAWQWLVQSLASL